MKPQNEVSVPQLCRQPPKGTRTSTKYSSATELQAPQVDNRETEEPVKSSQAERDASLVALHLHTRGDKSTDTKMRPRRKTSSPATDVRPLSATLHLNKNHECCFYLYNSTNMKNLPDWKQAQNRAPCLKIICATISLLIPLLC